ncbi:RabGAP/TBC [Parathielavia appendiculata]|uniref:RabGAP/TBC n=1 Tax=Parathielavia appendiculata TaxID=2587402 RepID=A0AAN6TY34_9PEZI|nr:RabGAP/TBC [Parathielavia appendiculata]
MAPQKFGSVRHKARPTATRLAPFRDDTGLVALRYEQTKQAEPPIPLPPPRNPRRINRSPSTLASSTSPTSPVTISPPPIPPPHEEHPLFRTQRPPRPSQAEERKRDSGAPTSSSVTLREEHGEEAIHQKLMNDVADTPSVYSNDDDIPERIDAPQTTSHQVAPPLLTVSIPPRTYNTETATSSSTLQSPASSSPARRVSLTRKLSISFGIGADGSKRLRKKMLGADRAASHEAPPDMEPVRGSPRSPKMPKGPPQLTGPGCSSADKGQAQSPEPLSSATTARSFAPITTHIPEDSLWDDLGAVSFSTRGSIMFGGKNNTFKSLIMSVPDDAHATASSSASPPEHPLMTTPTDNAAATVPDAFEADEADATAGKPRVAPLADAQPVPSIRVSSMDVERESQKVRSLYESGDDLNWEDGGRVSFVERLEPTAEVPSEEEENVVSSRPSDRPSASSPAPQSDHPNPTPATITPRSANSLSPRRDSQVRRDFELAGGIEDWADLEGAEVDRYGFIVPKRPVSRAETTDRKSSQLPSRRRNVLTKRPSTSYSASLPGGFIRPPSRKVSARSLNTYTSELSTVSRRSTRSSIRSATNRLPQNRDRRWMDEAGEMLSLQAGLTGITDEDKMGKTAEAQKRKEAERSEKWRKMAVAIKSSDNTGQGSASHPMTQTPQGEGMSYEFDTTSPKLIDRTWKGIPDCWRSAAWYSFLATSAKSHNSPETEDYLIAEFHRLQAVSSPDDVQIDLDVPRTVNGHIMFRRRYRGGQRLLFRVLHAISLYFPGTGYVQGMASLAATLLCYFDEERAFVMMVRLWRYRGLERLYQPGFAGLMAALGDFERRWLVGAGRDVAGKLNELSIDATAYGTRWYLTLFNLSIPFPAQLRVWDVFMLLGDCPPELSSSSSPPHSTTPTNSTIAPITTLLTIPSTPASTTTTTNTHAQKQGEVTQEQEKPPKGLDILHATSAALIHALRDVLLDSDFENAMKALTAWIPVKDEDLLMKVARAEWRRHRSGRWGISGSGSAGGGKLWDWDWDWERGGKGKDGVVKGKENDGDIVKEKEKGKDKGAQGKGKEKGKVNERSGGGVGRLWERGRVGREKDKEKVKETGRA